MDERFEIEAQRTQTGMMVLTPKEPVRFSPVHYYGQAEPDGHGRYTAQTVRQILAYEGEDRRWFDTFDEAMAVVYRYREGREAHAFDGRGTPIACEVAYWDNEATDWKFPECLDAACPIHNPPPCVGDECEGCVHCVTGGSSYVPDAPREDFHADG